nr:hypothetical protein [uncultured Lichenicoccus sp.]
MFDRRPIQGVMADKSAVREHVRQWVREQVLPKLLHVTADPRGIPFDAMPEKSVVKPTVPSGCRW